jgi:hypothetical protein
LFTCYSILAKIFMLPTEQISPWRQLLTLLLNLSTDSIPELKVSLNEAIELFERQILTQNIEDLEEPIAGKMRSYLTESHRLLRLLPLDLMFLEAARQPNNLQHRRQAYQDKLDLLIRYSRAIVGNQ